MPVQETIYENARTNSHGVKDSLERADVPPASDPHCGGRLRILRGDPTLQSYLTLGMLAVLAALFFLMNVYAYRRAKAAGGQLGVVAKGGIGGALGTLASVFGAASCPMCVASLFSFLGFGTVGFLARNQWWVFLAAIALMSLSLYFASRKVNGTCRACETSHG